MPCVLGSNGVELKALSALPELQQLFPCTSDEGFLAPPSTLAATLDCHDVSAAPPPPASQQALTEARVRTFHAMVILSGACTCPPAEADLV